MKYKTEFWACMILSTVWASSPNKYASIFAVIWMVLGFLQIVFSKMSGKDK